MLAPRLVRGRVHPSRPIQSSTRPHTLPPLPVEIHAIIISALENDLTDDRKVVVCTLRSCNLVSRAWSAVCRRILMRNIRLCSRRQLEDMILRPPSSFDSPLGFLVKLVLSGSLVEEDERPFHHLAPRYLARKAISLQVMSLFGDPDLMKSHPFPVNTSFTMHLGQFRSLAELSLSNHSFRSFWDLRRLVISPPSITFLRLHNVMWPSVIGDQRVPSLLLPITCRLSRVELSDCSSSHDMVWLWVMTFQSSSYNNVQYVGPVGSNNPHPALTVDHATAIEGFLLKVFSPTAPCKFVWRHDELWELEYRNQEYESKLKDDGSGSYFINYAPEYQSQYEESLRLPPPHFVFKYWSRVFADHKKRHIGLIHSLQYHIYHLVINDKRSSSTLASLDTLVDRLSDLRHVEFFCEDVNLHWYSKPSSSRRPNSSKAQAIARLMPLIQARSNLSTTFCIDREFVPWDGPEILLSPNWTPPPLTPSRLPYYTP